MKTREREKESRDSILLMLLILLLGFICIILSSGWALRFKPSWRLPTNMGSNLNPDSDFLTGRPAELLEPLDPAILTDPAWNDVFLTPSASFSTHAPRPTITSTPVPTNTRIPTITNSPTSMPPPTATNTLIFFPPSSPTPKPVRTPRPRSTDTPTATSFTLPSADLSITKTDGVATYTPGGALTYTIAVINNGPNAVAGAAVTDNFPAQITSATWTCTPSGSASCTASGSGSINQTVNLPVGSSVTYTVNATISAGATGSLTNTAMVSSAVTDPVSGNNSASDTDTQISVLSADLSITKTDNVATYVTGGTLTYTIEVTNNGPDDVNSAAVIDNFPAQVASANWTCAVVTGSATCTASGTGNISDSVNLPAGSSISYTVNVTIAPGATGSLTNTATVGSSVADPAPGNNSATDTDTQSILADLSIDKTDNVATYVPGGTLTYIITVVNNGPNDVMNATVTDNFPAQVASANWTCAVVTGSATCTASGTGNISDSVNLPAGSSISYTVDVTIAPGATGDLINTAIVGSSADDLNPGNNRSTDTDTP